MIQKGDRFGAMHGANSYNHASFIGSLICKAREGDFNGVEIFNGYTLSSMKDVSNFAALNIECYDVGPLGISILLNFPLVEIFS